ncbi:hypothetical protein [Calothrix sp. 336/3]|uniref:hypothetical protein n=1 Tax=Calothrix sp. 336/3 TaxID=1337936 RepID=UPI0004E441A4|nr:hypothetical protein [Calothrix sp. 336/3]AKG21676.1 hypothetical protein IJ00_10765 [Calothrix sp. 336/3]
MLDEENYYPQSDDYNRLFKDVADWKLQVQDNWSPCLETDLLAELKSPSISSIKVDESEKSMFKVSCVLIVILALLSIGMCIQADAIAQALREIARLSIQQTIRLDDL